MTGRVRVIATGVGLRGDGYPNAVNTLRVLSRASEFHVQDLVSWLPDEIKLWRLASGPIRARARVALKLTFGNLRCLVRVMGSGARPRSLVYVPYPSIFLLWWASWVPERVRPRIIADAYISVWDTIFRDRARGDGAGIAGRLVRMFEGRALRAAALVLTDTEANRAWMVRQFGLRESRVASMPLALGAPGVPFHEPPEDRKAGEGRPLEVLFVGTMVPLHGTEVIAGCLEVLKGDPRFHFTIVGDGQQAPLTEGVLAGKSERVTWERRWQSAESVRARIQQADVCLGVFGGQGKAARVLPFKVYLALAEGKPVLTQQWMSAPLGVPELPCITIDPTAQALVATLCHLADDRDALAELGARARAFHRQWLGDEAVLARWRTAVRRVWPQRSMGAGD